MRHHQDANTDPIRRAIDTPGWEKDFLNANEKVVTLNKTILNMVSNFIPHETLTAADKDPPWFTK